MPFAALSSVRLHYEVVGPAGARALLLLHGAAESFRQSWRRQIEPLAQHYRLIGPDLRGHGRSDNPADALDLRQMADDLAELLQVLNCGPAHVCGFSGGGSAALFLATRHPDRLRSLTLISNNFERDTRRNGALDFWNARRIRRQNPRWWQLLVETHPDPVRLLGWWAAEDRRRPDFRPEDLAGLDLPVLVMGGDRDPVVPLEQSLRLYQALPRGQLAILPGAGHGIQREQPAPFNEILLAFLAQADRLDP